MKNEPIGHEYIKNVVGPERKWLQERVAMVVAEASRRTRLEVLEEVEGMVRGQKASFVEGRTATYAGTRHLLLTRLASLKKKYEE